MKIIKLYLITLISVFGVLLLINLLLTLFGETRELFNTIELFFDNYLIQFVVLSVGTIGLGMADKYKVVPFFTIISFILAPLVILQPFVMIASFPLGCICAFFQNKVLSN